MALLLACGLALALLSACGTSGAVARRPARGAVVAAGSTPVLYRCSGRGVRRPLTFNIACGDGNGKYDQMSWRTWGHDFAAGRGRQWFNTCRPYCAAGHYRLYRVRVHLQRVRGTSAGTHFTRMRVVRRTGAPYRQTVPLPGP